MGSGCSTPKTVKAAAADARQPEGRYAPCGPALKEGFACNSSDMSKSLQAAFPESCLPARTHCTQNGADAATVAHFDLFHGQSDRCSPGRISKSDSCRRSTLSEGSTDISHATADCSSPGSMPVWLREHVVRQGDANPVMEFHREERPGQRTLIVARSLNGEVAAQIEEPEFDDELPERSDSAEPEIESSPSGLAMAEFLSEIIQQRQTSHTREEGSVAVAQFQWEIIWQREASHTRAEGSDRVA
eukprot:TRINITY_DN7234_c1_g1_i13.p1 TRINITY_DN7234_c1_g1~~TRINITY_DN7234_c1_g1_i13.p1  ORF type:complete len:245 (-),score=38.03 TRINITY_DN7234_c1_g1_i13:71-805(-)